MRSFKKGLLRQRRKTNTNTNLRHLVSVTAFPNLSGGCDLINVYFNYEGWVIGDEKENLQWSSTNIGEVININSCIDISTLTYNCIGRISFVWNDSIVC